MLAALCLLVTGPSRTEFYEALNTIKVGMTQAQVEAKLGPPDDIRKGKEMRSFNADVAWCYGTNGHLTFPTRATIVFNKGKVWWHRARELNTKGFKELMPERELVSLMRRIYETPRSDYYFQRRPDWTIRVVNMLQPLGAEKAYYVLREYERAGWISGDHLDLIDVARALFEPPTNSHMPSSNFIRPEVMKASPRFPMIVFEDIPFDVWSSTINHDSQRDLCNELSTYKHYKIRSTQLRPPDDPFVACNRLLQSPQWKAINVKGAVWPMYDRLEPSARWDVYAMVQHLIPEYVEPRREITAADFEKMHQMFLAKNPRWDPVKGRYVAQAG